MDYTFANASYSFTNMVQQDVPRDVQMSTGNIGQQNQSFSEKLNTVLDKIERHEYKAPHQIGSNQTNQDQIEELSDNAIDDLSEKLSREKGIRFVSALKNFFLTLSKGDLKNISIDSDGLEALRKMLLKAGFKENELNELIAELLDESENKDLTLDDFLDKLFDFSLEAESETKSSQENFLGISVIPFFESILNSLGISKDQVKEIFAEADKGEKGISLDVIIEKLQVLQKKSFYTQEDYKTLKGDENFKKLFQSLGLEPTDSKSSNLTLDGLLGSLEKLRQNISVSQVPADNQAKTVASEKSFDLLSTLFNGLEVKNKASENQVFGFSSDQIRDQFKNELLVPDMGKGDQRDSFLFKRTSKQAADTKFNDAFKEIEALLGGKKNGTADMADSLRDIKKNIKHIKSENTKLSDSSQLSTLTAKTNGAQSGLSIIKTKSAFKNLPAYVTHQVSKSLVRAINQGENVLKIQLKPPELGRLVVTIDNTGNSMKINIMTENHAAKEILASNINELRSVLSNSGVNLERFDVDMNSNFRQSMADAKNHTGNFGKRHRNREELDLIRGEGMNDTVSLLAALNQDGALHFIA